MSTIIRRHGQCGATSMNDDEIRIAKAFLKAMERIDRFMAKVEKTPTCWLWCGSRTGSGYGQFWNGKRTIPAHHFLLAAPVPTGMHACHSCDIKLCVNPEHIFIGTRSDNERDKVRKGRHNTSPGARAMLKTRHLKSGSSNHASVLTEEDVAMIKSISKAYGRGAALAKHFSVSNTVIGGIWRGKRWAHVTTNTTARQRAEVFLRVIGKWVNPRDRV